jgi:predicted N-acetyltransferase YhbS
MVITYKVNSKVEAHQFADLIKSSGLRRPVEDLNRLKKMLDNANLIVSAWDGERLIGIARALTDYSYCCYVSDLAVDREYQKQGIGQELITEVQKLVGDESMLLVIASPESMEYYPKIGFTKIDNAFLIPRKR